MWTTKTGSTARQLRIYPIKLRLKGSKILFAQVSSRISEIKSSPSKRRFITLSSRKREAEPLRARIEDMFILYSMLVSLSKSHLLRENLITSGRTVLRSSQPSRQKRRRHSSLMLREKLLGSWTLKRRLTQLCMVTCLKKSFRLTLPAL